MGNVIEISNDIYERLRAHLFQSAEENVAFLYAHTEHEDAGIRFETVGIHLVPPHGFTYRSGEFVSLTDEQLADVIKDAWDRRTALIEIHSHPDPHHAAGFSWSDLRGFEEVVPHVRWRLQGAPYAALVLTPDGFDALVWRAADSHTVEALAELRVGERVLLPTNCTIYTLKTKNDEYRAL